MKLILQWFVIMCLIIQSSGIHSPAFGATTLPSSEEFSNETSQNETLTETLPSINPENAEQNPVTVSQTQLNVEVKDLELTIKNTTQNKDIVLSTDSLPIAELVAQTTKAETGNRITKLIPIGKLVDQLSNAKNAAANKTERAWEHLKKSGRENKIGLVIVTFNTSYDSFVWLHATQYSTEVAVAQTIYSVLLALAFSVDTDLWSRLAWKVKGKILNLLGSDEKAIAAGTQEISRTKNLATTFAAHVSLSLGFQLVRMGICAYDHLITIPYLLGSAGTAVALATLFTFSSFGFSDFMAKIDQDRYPFAKFVFRRFAEVRGVFFGLYAPAGQVMAPGTYGFAPHILLFCAGIMGLGLNSQQERIVENVEKVPVLLRFRDRYQRLNENLLKSLQKIQNLMGLSKSVSATASRSLQCNMVM